MRTVSIHFDENIEFVFESPREAGDVGRSESGLGRSMHDVYLIVRGGQRVSDRSGPVRRIIVGDQDVCGGDARSDTSHNLRQGLSLVVGRDNDENTPEIIRRIGPLGHSPSVTAAPDAQGSPDALLIGGTPHQRGTAPTYIETEPHTNKHGHTSDDLWRRPQQ